MKENSIEEDMKILKEIIKGDEDCINAIYSQMKVKNDNDEDIQYFKKEIQSIKNIVNNYLKEKARADKLKNAVNVVNKEKADWIRAYQEEKDKQFDLLKLSIPIQEVKDLKDRILKNEEYTVALEGDKEFPDSTTEATFEKYINLKVLDKLIERRK